MRLSTVVSIALLAVSGAALAQVASTPAEQKVMPGNSADAAAPGTPDAVVKDEVVPADAAAGEGETRDDTLANDTLVLSNAADAR